jgi:hypothetical protein
MVSTTQKLILLFVGCAVLMFGILLYEGNLHAAIVSEIYDTAPFGTADYIKGEITDKLTLERADEKTLLITALVREFCTKCKVSATIISDDMAGSMKVVGPNHRRINHETV